MREAVEKFSIVKTLKAIADAQVVILTMDAHEGIVEQDLHLLGQCIEAGRALVIALNKWDGIEADERDWIRSELRDGCSSLITLTFTLFLRYMARVSASSMADPRGP